MIEIGYYLQKRRHQLAFDNMDPDCKFVVFIVIFCVAISDAMLAKSFSLEFDEDGICAMDTPSAEHFSSAFIQCGVLCVNKPECLQYNHIQATSSCELFNYLPSSFTSINSCRSLKSTVSANWRKCSLLCFIIHVIWHHNYYVINFIIGLLHVGIRYKAMDFQCRNLEQKGCRPICTQPLDLGRGRYTVFIT